MGVWEVNGDDECIVSVWSMGGRFIRRWVVGYWCLCY